MLTNTNHLLGALAALGSAFLWALSAIIFQRLSLAVAPVALNLGKGLVAIVCIGALLLSSGLAQAPFSVHVYLALSGLLGICLGDTLYFVTLSLLGSRVTLLLGSLIPVSVGLMAVAVLGETVTGLGWSGIALTLLGVTYVLWQRTEGGRRPENWRRGIVFGLFFVLANACGIMFTKIGVSALPALDATFFRTLWAVAGLTFWGMASGSLLNWLKPLQHPRALAQLIFAALVGAFLGTWLSVAALKYTHAAVAAAFNSTSPLFILPLAHYLLKERVSVTSVIGAAVAVAGIAVYFLSL